MNILIVEPFYGGSHKTWINGLRQNLSAQFYLLTMPERWWKWRMQGAAITMAKRYRKKPNHPDLIIASDMLDVSTFLSLSGLGHVPLLLYFHENQFAYPEQESNKADIQYAFINYTSALAADTIAFNSKYNKETFFKGLEEMLRAFPDYRNMETVDQIRRKSTVLPLGVEFPNATGEKPGHPVILWNHRWEHDKNPEEFFKALGTASRKGLFFELILAGKNYRSIPEAFENAFSNLSDHIIHKGYASETEYEALLQKANLLPVTSLHDFFGISVAEAVYSGCFPLLPNRLAYPELIRPSKFPLCFYESFEDSLIHTLETFSKQKIRREETVKDLQKEIIRFSWKRMKAGYEKIFQDTIYRKKIGSTF